MIVFPLVSFLHLAGQLEHPGIVPIYELGQLSGLSEEGHAGGKFPRLGDET
jgi:hypothetical protein